VKKDEPILAKNSVDEKTLEVEKPGQLSTLADERYAVPCLLVLSGPMSGRYYKLGGESMVIGRSLDADILIHEEGISRAHAQLIPDSEGCYRIEDLESTNGIMVNGVPGLRSSILKNGDRIRLGTATVLKFTLQDTLDQTYQRQMYESAILDALTFTYNRRYLEDTLVTEFAYHKRHGLPLSLVMLDIDHFKKINDTYGHPCGDFVIKSVASAVQGFLRTEDVLARYGGEEFAVLLRSTGVSEAFSVAERIRQGLETEKFVFDDAEVKVTASLGCSTLNTQNYETSDLLVAAADASLYDAKKAGRNRTVSASE
jgi:two-component system, cell cycle response regulator